MIGRGMLTRLFGEEANPPPNTDFFAYLQRRFNSKTALKTIDVFKNLNLPLPEHGPEFLRGNEGGFVFLNEFAMIIRIEKAHTVDAERINDSPWISQPIATIEAGEALIEICPGCLLAAKDENIDYLGKQLGKEGINFWDQGLRNIGLMPVKTPLFPQGIPVVIDRLACERLKKSTESIREALTAREEAEVRDAMEAQKKLYGELKEAFKGAWSDGAIAPDAEKMEKFWDLCRKRAQEGNLVAGWNEYIAEYGIAGEAARAAKEYALKIKPEFMERQSP